MRSMAVRARHNDGIFGAVRLHVNAHLHPGGLFIMADGAINGTEFFGVGKVLDLLEVGVTVGAADLRLPVDRGLEFLLVQEQRLAWGGFKILVSVAR
jgi:hypothetical protein